MAKRSRARRRGFRLAAALFFAFLLVAAAAAIYWYLVLRESPDAAVRTGEFSVHFLDVGNKYTGDSIYIQYGETDILIDAGSRQSSAKTVGDYVEAHSEDGVLEYVIATHADQDHIAGFVGTAKEKGIFERFEVGTVIDFPLTNKSAETSSGNLSLYGQYLAARDAEVEAGAAHYTALQCWNEEGDAKRVYPLGDGGVTMKILYNYYYENKSSDENNYSVCLLFTQGANHYLFTGDLEEKGEEYLVQYNDLPRVKLFKAGHHGSATSSTEALLEVIRPEIVCICCCAGSSEYATSFPTQAMIDRIAPYTSRIYVTALADDSADGYSPFNGTVVVSSDGGEVSVEGSNGTVVLKESAWFAENRVWPADGKK